MMLLRWWMSDSVRPPLVHRRTGHHFLKVLKDRHADLRRSIQRRFRLAHTLVLGSGYPNNLRLNAPVSAAVHFGEHFNVHAPNRAASTNGSTPGETGHGYVARNAWADLNSS
jgi:hypothetical protein